MGKNGNTSIKLVQYGASTTNGEAAPGVAWTCTGKNTSTISGTLSGTFSGSLSGNASTATNVAWSGVTGKPSTFTPSSHTHGQYYDSSIARTANTVLAAPNGSNGGATFRKLVEADIPSLSKSKVGLGNVDNTADSAKSVKYAASAGTANSVAWSNVSGKPGSLPASDVYAWAKASSKPSYSWGEISGKPSTFTPSSHNHTLIAEVASGSAVPGKAADGFIEFYYNVNNGLTNNMPSNNNANAIISLSRHAGDYSSQLGFSSDGNIYYRDGVGTTSWKTVLDSSNYTSYTVTKSGSGASGTWGINVTGSAGSVAWGNVSGRPSSMPASDVYSWAKASSKPSYSWSEISGKPSSFTPSSHTHTIANITNLQSTLDSKASNSNTIKGVSANGYWGLATPANNSVDWIRTTSYGLLPSQSGSARSGHSTLGTSSWYFSNAYIDSINTSEIKIGQPNNSNNGGIELYGASPYIDFHTSGTNTDYSSRIIAYSDRIEFVFA